MRFYSKYPKNGEKRIRTFFAFFPVSCGEETRWLEHVCIEQSYWSGWGDAGWSNVRFIDDGHNP
jgi:hypothetical protein